MTEAELRKKISNEVHCREFKGYGPVSRIMDIVAPLLEENIELRKFVAKTRARATLWRWFTARAEEPPDER